MESARVDFADFRDKRWICQQRQQWMSRNRPGEWKKRFWKQVGYFPAMWCWAPSSLFLHLQKEVLETRLCKHLPPLRAHCYVVLSNDWGSPSGCFLPQHQDKTQILFSGLPSQLCTCFLLHSSYTHTLGPLCCVSWDLNSHWRALGQMSHHPAHAHWLFQRGSGGKAAYNMKRRVVSAKNPGVRGRWQGDVFEREPPRGLLSISEAESQDPPSVYQWPIFIQP